MVVFRDNQEWLPDISFSVLVIDGHAFEFI
jgi:hypothetical protein